MTPGPRVAAGPNPDHPHSHPCKRDTSVRLSHRFLLGLALGAVVAFITRALTDDLQLAIGLGVTVLVLVWLGEFILDVFL